MSRHTARRLTRRHALALLAVVALVWCQIAASALPGAFFRRDGAGVVSAAAVSKAAEMAGMVGCQSAADQHGQSTSHCASDHATSDHATVPVLAALPPALPFALVYAVERVPVELVRSGCRKAEAPLDPGCAAGSSKKL